MTMATIGISIFKPLQFPHFLKFGLVFLSMKHNSRIILLVPRYKVLELPNNTIDEQHKLIDMTSLSRVITFILGRK